MTRPTRRLLTCSPRAVLAAPSLLASAWAVCAALAVGLPSPAASPRLLAEEPAFARDNASRERFWQKEIRPLVERFCFDCHSGPKAEGGLRLEAAATHQQLLEGRAQWLKVTQKLQNGEMPPADHEQPTAAQRALLAGWLEDALRRIDCAEIRNPGKVTIRRLNRAEYRNTVRDLVDVVYEPARDFPGDDVGYGFDNIGDVLSLPPLLMEKYLRAAEEIASQAIVTEFESPVDIKKRGQQMTGSSGSGEYGGNGRILTTTGQVSFTLEIPQGGEYEFTVLAFGDQAGDEPVKMSFVVDDKTIQTVDVPETEENAKPRTFKTRLAAGKHTFAWAFLNDYYSPGARNPRRRDRNLIVMEARVRGALGFKGEPPPRHKTLVFVTPGEGVTRQQAFEKVLGRLASRAYRRPASDAEVARLRHLAEQVAAAENSYERGVQVALMAILSSPHFLFKIEEPPDPARVGATRQINDYELATSLSYFLWSTMPDQELFNVAFQGKLRQDAELERQVRRMLAHPKATALVDNFASQWLQLRLLDGFSPDPKLFPEFNEPLRAAMRRETELFFQAMIRDDRSVLELLDADYTYLNGPLAKFYGVEGVAGDEFRKVSLAGSPRGGVLTHASVLSVTSNPTRTSPVKRGKWVLENLLGAPPPPPAANVPELEAQKNLTGTLRQRMEQHRANPACATCHRQMDALGFALENFNAIGRWREQDEGLPIDALGELPDGARFNGPAELRRVLATRRGEEFARCLTEKLLTYALGRGLEYYDQCAVESISAALPRDDHRFSRLVLEIVRSQPFQYRQTQRIAP